MHRLTVGVNRLCLCRMPRVCALLCQPATPARLLSVNWRTKPYTLVPVAADCFLITHEGRTLQVRKYFFVSFDVTIGLSEAIPERSARGTCHTHTQPTTTQADLGTELTQQ